MKKYSIGLVTGIVFSISAFMFIGAAQGIASDAVTSNGMQYSFIVGSDGGFSMVDHKNGKAYIADVKTKKVMEFGKGSLTQSHLLVVDETK